MVHKEQWAYALVKQFVALLSVPKMCGCLRRHQLPKCEPRAHQWRRRE